MPIEDQLRSFPVPPRHVLIEAAGEIERLRRDLAAVREQLKDAQCWANTMEMERDAARAERERAEGALTSAVADVIAARAEAERERLRLAACGVAAMGNTDAMVADRLTPEHPYYSASYGDVCRAVDREMAHRAEARKLEDAVTQMSRAARSLEKKLEAEKAEAARLRAIIKLVEFVEVAGPPGQGCAWCGEYPTHEPDCLRQSALKIQPGGDRAPEHV